MSKYKSSSAFKAKSSLRDDETKQEIDRQHALLLASLDKKQLLGNVTMEDHRHHRQAASLTQKERRERYEITTQKKELLHDLRKVRSSYTGHYDDTKSPFENIQQALRTKCQTPSKSSRLSPASNTFAMRRCVSNEMLRPSTSLGGASGRPVSSSGEPGDSQKTRPKTAAVVTATNKPKKGNSSTKKPLKKETNSTNS